MKKILYTLLLMLCVTLVPSFASANNKDLSTSSFSSNFAVINGGTYYLNDYSVNNSTKGIYKMSSNLKSSKLIVAGDFRNIQSYKDTMIAYDYEKGHLVQYSLAGKLIKNLVNIDSSNYQVYGNHVYFYKSENKSFYQSQIVGNKLQYLRNTGNSYTDEFIIENGWLYYVHTFTFGANSEDYLSKFNIAKPATATKLISKRFNIDSLIAKNNYIYAVVHKKGISEGRTLYRVNTNGKNLTQISKKNMSQHAINSKYVYFIENSFNDRQKLYRMTINGKNVKAIATLPGRVHTLDANGISLYLTIREKTTNPYEPKYSFQRRVVQ